MENENHMNESVLVKTRLRNIVFKGHISFFVIYLFLFIINYSSFPDRSIDALIEFLIYFYSCFITVFLLSAVVFFSLVHLTHPKNLPKGTTLYQSIHSPTMMIGAIKIIHPLENPTDQVTDDSLSIEDV
jgi:hypothetical protein